jgi:hypothetical protein
MEQPNTQSQNFRQTKRELMSPDQLNSNQLNKTQFLRSKQIKQMPSP